MSESQEHPPEEKQRGHVGEEDTEPGVDPGGLPQTESTPGGYIDRDPAKDMPRVPGEPEEQGKGALEDE